MLAEEQKKQRLEDNKRELDHVLRDLLGLHLDDRLCTCLSEHPDLNVRSILFAVGSPSKEIGSWDDTAYLLTSREFDLVKLLSAFGDHLMEYHMPPATEPHPFLLFTKKEFDDFNASEAQDENSSSSSIDQQIFIYRDSSIKMRELSPSHRTKDEDSFIPPSCIEERHPDALISSVSQCLLGSSASSSLNHGEEPIIEDPLMVEFDPSYFENHLEAVTCDLNSINTDDFFAASGSPFLPDPPALDSDVAEILGTLGPFVSR